MKIEDTMGWWMNWANPVVVVPRVGQLPQPSERLPQNSEVLQKQRYP